MGNWRNRPPRRFFYSQNAPTLSSYDNHPEFPPNSGIVEADGVPVWEKKFCYSIGSVPWRKIVDSKKFMYCHNNIANWDDSASEEAFHSAKKRFWSEINGLPCDISLPDPDIYIDEINWNPDIDPELVKDMEQSLFVPDEGEQDNRLWRRNKRRRNFAAVHSGGYYRNAGDARDARECDNNIRTGAALEDKANTLNQQGADANNSINVNKSGNHWEQVSPHGNTAVRQQGADANNSSTVNKNDSRWEQVSPDGNTAVRRNTWEDSVDKSSGWNRSGTAVVHGNAEEDSGSKLCGWTHSANLLDESGDRNDSKSPWEQSSQGDVPVKESMWCFRNGSWGYHQQNSRNLNKCSSAWGSSLPSSSETTTNGGGWADGRWKANGPDSRGWKQRDNYGYETQNSGGGWGAHKDSTWKNESTSCGHETQNPGCGWGARKDSNWKNESTQQNAARYRNTRFQGHDYHISHSWRGGRN